MVSTGEFLLQLLQTKDAPILLDDNVFNSKQQGFLYLLWDLVDFKFSIDLAEMNISWVIFAPIAPNES